MQVVKVDGTVMLGVFADNAVTDAMVVGMDVMEEVQERMFKEYLCNANIGKLMSVQIGATSAVSKRARSSSSVYRCGATRRCWPRTLA